MPPIGLIVFGATLSSLIGLGLWGYRHYSRSAVARRALRRMPVQRIADVADGSIVKVAGAVRLVEGPLQAPLSKRPCVYWRVVVHELRHRAGPLLSTPGSWWRLADEAKSVRFVVDDGSGTAVVGASRSTVAVSPHRRGRARWADGETDPALKAFFEHHGIRPTDTVVMPRPLRYSEVLLEEGAQVVVLGKARWEPDPLPPSHDGPGYRERAYRLVLEPTPQGRLDLSDDPRLAK